MTGYTRRDLPADIDVFAGDFASQPLAFAHLLDAAPALDLTHVEVIQGPNAEARLATYFTATTTAEIRKAATSSDTLILILPAAFEGHSCPLTPTGLLSALGTFRGTVPRLVAT